MQSHRTPAALRTVFGVGSRVASSFIAFRRGHESHVRPNGLKTCALVLLTLAFSGCGGGGSSSGGHPPDATASRELVIDATTLAALPTTGAAWNHLVAVAQEPIASPDLSDQDDRDNVRVLARAFVHARTVGLGMGESALRDEVIAACQAIIGTQGGSTLPLGRELAAYVIAADLVGLPAAVEADFRAFLASVRTQSIGGRTLISTHEDRPNNWGTHAGASRIAIARYLDDSADLAAAAAVFRGWLGERAVYDGFDYGDLSWQAAPGEPVGVNSPGTMIQGHDVSGVLPDDQRRGGAFQWPPPQENYVYEALQGALLQAILLERAGYDVWAWSDEAMRRAFDWLHGEASYVAAGDDQWQPFVVNHAYATSYPTVGGGANPGKNFGFTDWLYAP